MKKDGILQVQTVNLTNEITNKEEAEQRVFELTQQAVQAIAEATELAKQHGVVFSFYDAEYSATFYPTQEDLLNHNPWLKHRFRTIPETPCWVSSSYGC